MTATIGIELAGDMLTLKSPGLGILTVPLKKINTCLLFGERVIPIDRL